MINYIRNEKSINNDCVKSRMIELSCILSEYVRLYYFFWLTSQRNDSGLLRICYMNNLFTKEDPNSFLSAVMCYVCTEKKLEITDVDICSSNLDIADYSNEDFDTTYNRLFNNHKE